MLYWTRDVCPKGMPFPPFLSCPHLSTVSYEAAVTEGFLVSPEMIIKLALKSVFFLMFFFFVCLFLFYEFPSHLSLRNSRLTHRIVECLRFQGTLKGILLPWAELPTTRSGCSSSLALDASRLGTSISSLGNLYQCLPSNLYFPFLSLKPFSLVLSLPDCVKSWSPSCLSLQVLEGHDKSPQSLLQAKQAQLLQPFFIGELLQSFFVPFFWDPLQQLHIILVMRVPSLDAEFWTGPQKGRTEEESHLSLSALQSSFDAAQDTTGLPGYRCTLLAPVQPFICQDPQIVLPVCRHLDCPHPSAAPCSWPC